MTLLFYSTVDSAARWRAQLERLTGEFDIRVWPEIGDPADIDYALVWRPEPGLLAALPNLKLILSLGAGVDHLLGDPQLPRHLPIVRLVDPHMTAAMSEYVALQVLRLHRGDLDYRAQQQAKEWRELDQKNAADRRVGILGFGELGQDAAGDVVELGIGDLKELVARKGLGSLTIAESPDVSKKQHPVEEHRIIGHCHSCLPARNRLGCVQAKASDVAPGPHWFPVIAGAVRVGAVLDYCEPSVSSDLDDRVHFGRISPCVDHTDGLGASAYATRHVLRIKRQGSRIDVAKDRCDLLPL